MEEKQELLEELTNLLESLENFEDISDCDSDLGIEYIGGKENELRERISDIRDELSSIDGYFMDEPEEN